MPRVVRAILPWVRLGGFAIVVVAVAVLIPALLPKRPANPPATTLTADQLAQRPVLVYPGATAPQVHRSARTFAPDEPSPERPRLEQRITSYYVVADPAEIREFFRMTLTDRGWQPCHAYTYRRASQPCDGDAAEWISLSIAIAANTSLYAVTVTETLPPPLEWPEP